MSETIVLNSILKFVTLCLFFERSATSKALFLDSSAMSNSKNLSSSETIAVIRFSGFFASL